MLKAVVFAGDKYFAVEMVGHAGYAESGKDIVCAACSALFIALSDYIRKSPSEWFVGAVELKEFPGNHFRLEMTVNKRHYAEVAAAVKVFDAGIKFISNAYPGNVTLKSNLI